MDRNVRWQSAFGAEQAGWMRVVSDQRLVVMSMGTIGLQVITLGYTTALPSVIGGQWSCAGPDAGPYWSAHTPTPHLLLFCRWCGAIECFAMGHRFLRKAETALRNATDASGQQQGQQLSNGGVGGDAVGGSAAAFQEALWQLQREVHTDLFNAVGEKLGAAQLPAGFHHTPASNGSSSRPGAWAPQHLQQQLSNTLANWLSHLTPRVAGGMGIGGRKQGEVAVALGDAAHAATSGEGSRFPAPAQLLLLCTAAHNRRCRSALTRMPVRTPGYTVAAR